METNISHDVRCGQVYYKEFGTLGILSLSVDRHGINVNKCIGQNLSGTLQVETFDWVEFFVQDNFVVVTKRYPRTSQTLIRPFVGVVTTATETNTNTNVSSSTRNVIQIRVAHDEYASIMHNTQERFVEGDLVCFSYPSVIEGNIRLLQRIDKSQIGVCQICLEHEELFSLCDCQHTACKGCCKDYLLYIYKDVSQYPLKCSKAECGKLISLTEAAAHLDTQQFSDLETFYCFAAIPERNRSKCPRCNHLMFYGNAYPNGQCHRCGLEYCGRCSLDAHTGRSCESQQSVTQEAQRLAETLGYKTCPQCSTIIEKVKGCNHMQHQSCSRPYSEDGSTHFCYCCGALLINARQTVDRLNHFPRGLFKPCVDVNNA